MCRHCLLQVQAADDREAELRRSLKDAESGHKQQLANLDATARGLQRYTATHPVATQATLEPSQTCLLDVCACY